MKFLLIDSNTTSNIGNAFFYEGVRYALKHTVAGAQVLDGAFPPYNAYRLSPKQESLYFNYADYVGDVDALVIAGPVLDSRFEDFFGPALRRARKDGKKIFLLSAGARKYDQEEFEHCSKLLKEVQPDVFISRDHDTFQQYGQFAKHAYDGMCFAFFVAEYYQGYETPALQPYMASTFDFGAEPDLTKLQVSDIEAMTAIVGEKKGGKTRSLKGNLSFLFDRKGPDSVNGIRIVRPAHKPLRSKYMIFFKKNTFVAFNHEPYLNLYKNAKLTLTDRLHAAVVTLAFGNPARLYLSSNRTRLLEAAGCEAATKGIWKADLAALAAQRQLQKNWLRQTLSAIGMPVTSEAHGV
ncbi:polysaccharide pyruvyl transferase family protein [Planctomicrobium piriforme]|uniref:Polysaccharide pyruvyl transferase domain-containing protein n=1 Tax=Planctomicrobium piriforme TaxID=1576369 RepID=A0A1I3DE44_9PLAN|nr:polysaccharide pyruvyl transferase family protein [Planctomicrobium piriforme]SFH84828.1 hypothetical protein SAMN05421753_103194 [Planctomicrobium piriforme]